MTMVAANPVDVLRHIGVIVSTTIFVWGMVYSSSSIVACLLA